MKSFNFLKAMVAASSLIGVMVHATGGLQGNGVVLDNVMLGERAKLEVLSSIAGKSNLHDILVRNNRSLLEVIDSADAISASDANTANRGYIANQLSSSFNFNAEDSASFSSVLSGPSIDSNFLSSQDFLAIYPAVSRPAQIVLGSPTIAGQLCNANTTRVIVDQRSQLIHIISAGVVVGAESRPLGRSSCLLAIPLTKTAKKGLFFQAVDVHGLVAKFGAAAARISLEAFTTGAHGPVANQSLIADDGIPAKVSRFFVRAGASPAGVSYGQGSSSLILRLNLSLLVQAQNQVSAGVVALDRVTIKYGLR